MDDLARRAVEAAKNGQAFVVSPAEMSELRDMASDPSSRQQAQWDNLLLAHGGEEVRGQTLNVVIDWSR